MELLDKVLNWQNLLAAQRRVIKNEGATGVDRMSVDELEGYFREHGEAIVASIRAGTYQPQPVLGVEIEKMSGGTRLLGIPTVIDRMIQQAIHQVLSLMYEPEFSRYSFGFRPGRGAQMAIKKLLDYINSGYCDIIDLDLKSFFDVVNHDYLMSLLYRRIKDERLLRLIRKYLKAGIMPGGATQQREEGTPQGSPLSPLLSNILLNELDKELESRGLRFVRYADDCSIFVHSKRAAQRVLASVTRFIEQKLKLKVNNEKTNICRPSNFHTLGYQVISVYDKGAKGKYRLRVSPVRFKRMKQRVREITRKSRPISTRQRIMELNSYMRGWIGYYRYAHMQEKLKDLDVWIRRRLRYCIWKHWKKPNRRMRACIRMGIPKGTAYAWSRSGLGGWRQACSPMMSTTVTIPRLKRAGYIEFSEYYTRFSMQLNAPIKFD